MARRSAFAWISIAAMLCIAAIPGQERSRSEAAPGAPTASGVLKPVGRPSRPPSRTDAGQSCLVDLEQEYRFSGTLSGSATIDYRILVEGPCGQQPGTFPENWIAGGKFTGTLDGTEVSGRFSYVAEVAAGGEVTGTIVLGQGLRGELQVAGRFSDRQLSYKGWAR
jgi:hypothetical protein